MHDDFTAYPLRGPTALGFALLGSIAAAALIVIAIVYGAALFS
jgi:hypothetical protein